MAWLGRLVGRRAPNVEALVARGDYLGLVQAARYRRVVDVGGGELADLGVEVRVAALNALGELEDIGTSAVADALADPFEEVRTAAVDALRRRGDFELLCGAVASWPAGADGRPRGAAIEALLELRAEGSGLALASALVAKAGDEPMVSGDAALVRVVLDTESREGAAGEVVAHLIEKLSARRAAERKRAEALLATLPAVSVDPLLDALWEGTARAAAASVLGEIKDQRAVEPLISALEEPDRSLRAAACRALGELRDPVAVAPLMRLTRDPEHAVRAAAGAALDRFGTVAMVFGMAALLGPGLDQGDTAATRQRLLTDGSSEQAGPEVDFAKLAAELFNRAGR